MSNTNQVCITCTQRDGCQYYDPNRTLCVPVKVSDYGQFAGSFLKQSTIDWQHYRIQASIELACRLDYMLRAGYSEQQVAERAVKITDALIAELQKKGDEQ